MSIPSALFAAARSAIRCARQCERQANLYDKEWHDRKLAAAKDARDAAAFYLRSRRWRINDALEAERQAEKRNAA